MVLGELAGVVRREEARAREGPERVRRPRAADPRVGPAVDELERLAEELDVDDPAAAVLDVQAPRSLPAELDLHPLAELHDLLEVRAGERAAVDDAGQGRPDAPPERPLPSPGVAAHEPGARERLPLPEVAPVLVVALERRDARREAAARAAGPEPEVHGEDDAGRRDVAEQARQPLDGGRVERVGEVVLRAVDDEEVEVGP